MKKLLNKLGDLIANLLERTDDEDSRLWNIAYYLSTYGDR